MLMHTHHSHRLIFRVLYMHVFMHTHYRFGKYITSFPFSHNETSSIRPSRRWPTLTVYRQLKYSWGSSIEILLTNISGISYGAIWNARIFDSRICLDGVSPKLKYIEKTSTYVSCLSMHFMRYFGQDQSSRYTNFRFDGWFLDFWCSKVQVFLFK